MRVLGPSPPQGTTPRRRTTRGDADANEAPGEPWVAWPCAGEANPQARAQAGAAAPRGARGNPGPRAAPLRLDRARAARGRDLPGLRLLFRLERGAGRRLDQDRPRRR